jgi:hypothetical protein
VIQLQPRINQQHFVFRDIMLLLLQGAHKNFRADKAEKSVLCNISKMSLINFDPDNETGDFDR